MSDPPLVGGLRGPHQPAGRDTDHRGARDDERRLAASEIACVGEDAVGGPTRAGSRRIARCGARRPRPAGRAGPCRGRADRRRRHGRPPRSPPPARPPTSSGRPSRRAHGRASRRAAARPPRAPARPPRRPPPSRWPPPVRPRAAPTKGAPARPIRRPRGAQPTPARLSLMVLLLPTVGCVSPPLTHPAVPVPRRGNPMRGRPARPRARRRSSRRPPRPHRA
jgi:hypothetical protein